jgi:hypothetical protein
MACAESLQRTSMRGAGIALARISCWTTPHGDSRCTRSTESCTFLDSPTGQTRSSPTERAQPSRMQVSCTPTAHVSTSFHTASFRYSPSELQRVDPHLHHSRSRPTGRAARNGAARSSAARTRAMRFAVKLRSRCGPRSDNSSGVLSFNHAVFRACGYTAGTNRPLFHAVWRCGADALDERRPFAVQLGRGCAAGSRAGTVHVPSPDWSSSRCRWGDGVRSLGSACGARRAVLASSRGLCPVPSGDALRAERRREYRVSGHRGGAA